jgi:hypothetical protein
MTHAGSAALSSSNTAGGGVLVKAYAAPDANSATFWDDTKSTYVSIWSRLLGLPDDQSSLFGGLMAPVFSELSGVIMFTDAGAYRIRLHCEGWCSLYIYGRLSLMVLCR